MASMQICPFFLRLSQSAKEVRSPACGPKDDGFLPFSEALYVLTMLILISADPLHAAGLYIVTTAEIFSTRRRVRPTICNGALWNETLNQRIAWVGIIILVD